MSCSRIYLASRYSASTRERRVLNVERAMAVGAILLRKGYQPLVPVISHYLDEFANLTGDPISYNRWMEWALTWVKQCEAVLVISMSPGVEREIECALENKIPIFYSISELPPPQL